MVVYFRDEKVAKKVEGKGVSNMVPRSTMRKHQKSIIKPGDAVSGSSAAVPDKSNKLPGKKSQSDFRAMLLGKK